jgi:hypothetical protein
MKDTQQGLLFEDLPLLTESPLVEQVVAGIREIFDKHSQPSAWELLNALEMKLGLKVRWVIRYAIQRLLDDSSAKHSQRTYLHDLLDSDDWKNAVRGRKRPAHEVESSVDALFRESAAYRSSESFQEMINFMGNFRDYAPFNNMLVKLQNPSCSFFATQSDWRKRFERWVKEDARPMIILAPMHPVVLVYDLDSTDGPELPQEIRQFAQFHGEWNPERLRRTINAARIRDLIRIDSMKLSSTNAGFAAILAGQNRMKMRIVLHDELDEPSRYGVLLHELAHVYLGHLGSDDDGWWPCRVSLSRRAMEVEAETVAHIVSQRAGLKGASSRYVSRYLDEVTLRAISVDTIAKVAGRLEEMATRKLQERRPKRAVDYRKRRYRR